LPPLPALARQHIRQVAELEFAIEPNAGARKQNSGKTLHYSAVHDHFHLERSK
jgi:hypothetical protein